MPVGRGMRLAVVECHQVVIGGVAWANSFCRYTGKFSWGGPRRPPAVVWTKDPMQIRFHCPTEACVAIIEYEPLEQCGSAMKCPRCGVEHPIALTEPMRANERVDKCAVCGGTEMFVRKEFPQRFGVAVVLIFGVAALYYFTVSLAIAWCILAGAIVIDVVVYALIGRVTSCYACRAEYRKCQLNPKHEGFDLAASEKY